MIQKLFEILKTDFDWSLFDVDQGERTLEAQAEQTQAQS